MCSPLLTSPLQSCNSKQLTKQKQNWYTINGYLLSETRNPLGLRNGKIRMLTNKAHKATEQLATVHKLNVYMDVCRRASRSFHFHKCFHIHKHTHAQELIYIYTWVLCMFVCVYSVWKVVHCARKAPTRRLSVKISLFIRLLCSFF